VLRVPGINLLGTAFQNNKIRIQSPVSPGYAFVAFEIYKVSLNGANTEVSLKKSVPGSPQEPMFQPYGTIPVMRYDSVIPVISHTGVSSIVVDLAGEPIINALTGGQIQLISSGNDDVYSTTNAAGPLRITLGSITVDSLGTHVELTLDPSYELSTDFANGNISFIFEAEVALDTATIPNPQAICNILFEINFQYSYLTPIPVGMTNPFSYIVWDEPDTWPVEADLEPSYYTKLKKVYEIIRSSATVREDCLSIITENLHTNVYEFSLLMEIFLSYEEFLNSMYSYDQPDMEKRYQAASILRNCARKKLDANWVKEEIKHISSGVTYPAQLMLNAQYFWKALTDPSIGSWDPSLQTIPDNYLEITSSNVAIIDPELVSRDRLLISPDAEPYIDLYNTRQEQLEDKRREYFSLLMPFNVAGFKLILNEINTGSQLDDYDIYPPYPNMTALITAFQSNDAFVKQEATEVLYDAFALTPEEFSLIIPIMTAYQDADPSNQPTPVELRSVANLLTTACKRKQMYFTDNMGNGWISPEISMGVKYYNVFQLCMDPIRGNSQDRSLWQQTLAKWNRVPTVFPDIVPPENMKEFVNGEVVHDLWIGRKGTLDYTFTDMGTVFSASLTFTVLFYNFREILLSDIVRRKFGAPSATYYPYFTALFEKEDAGEDIRPYLNQLNVRISEYRFLREIYTVLKNGAETTPTSLSNLLSSEFDSVINIFIRIHTSNTHYFALVEQEYDYNIVLTGEDFLNYSPPIINFPINLVQETEQWRSPNADKKAWKDTLNARIERKEKVEEEWNRVIEETEDITLPVMRDALIQALRNNCESFDAAAERIAKTLFVETKDNCCVKHSRVSHAIETIQGLIFALESGVYDNYLNGFFFTAPNFDKEWQWLGSYATWRSAVFTYIYPENLLYPTLKRKQSPAFIELADTIGNANRFTPINACEAAKKYQAYFEDIQNLKLVCTANTEAYIFRKDPLDCCGDMNNSMREYMTFYFGQSKLTGKGYYSSKP
ncbi:neuraminidase-like domain-containing protein, partial [Fluviicola sp.]|uniref:neuraminidase-like domain-containing protein n=1 Tax=Fluviicola sp. TaxID=1917219 RepID=UPI00262416B0